MYTTQSDDARVTAATSLLLQLLIISLHFAQLVTRLFPRASYLQLFVDSSAIDSGVTLGASNQPRQPRSTINNACPNEGIPPPPLQIS